MQQGKDAPAAGASVPRVDMAAPECVPSVELMSGDEQGECLGCRVTGLMLGLGGCGYLSSRLWVPPYPVGAHRAAIIGVSTALFALGLGRAAGF